MRKITDKQALLIGLMVLIIIMCPYLLLGEDAFITIHDFLDSNPVHVHTLISMGLIGNPDGVLPVLDGVPSMNYMSLIPISVKNFLYIILPLYWAIIFNVLFVRAIAFTGMYLLCRNYILKDNILYSLFVSILYCLIPFYADYGLSSAGVPLFLYSVLNIDSNKKLCLSFVLIVFFACNSSLALVGIFICMFWIWWIIYKWMKKDDVYKYHLLGLLLICIVYLFVNISVIYNYLFPSDILSHRVEFVNSSTISDDIITTINVLYHSQYHVGDFLPILFVTFSFIIFLFGGWKDKAYGRLLYVYMILAALIFLGALLRHVPIKLFSSFQFDRFYFIYPTICFVLFAKSLSFLQNKIVVVAIISFLLMCSTIKYDNELFCNYEQLTGIGSLEQPSFKQYFDVELFSRLKRELNIEDDYSTKVVSVGMHPSVAEYNNFYTLDSYVFSYSLEYKHKFRKIIEKELGKDDKLRTYFDNWGSRCYVFSSELDEEDNRYLYGKKDNITITKLDIDIKLLKDLKCEYILSSVEIENYKDMNLDYVNSYTTDESYWNIRIYKLI